MAVFTLHHTKLQFFKLNHGWNDTNVPSEISPHTHTHTAQKNSSVWIQGAKPAPTAQQVAQGIFVHLFLNMPQLRQWCFERPVMLRESCPQFIGIPQGNIIKFFHNIVLKSLRSAQAWREQTMLGCGAGRPGCKSLVCWVFWTGAINHKPLVYAPGWRRGGKEWAIYCLTL